MRLSRTIFITLFLAVTISISSFAKDTPKETPPEGISFTVVVYDGTNNAPLELARVALYRGSSLVKGKVTNPQGRAVFSDVVAGKYRILVRSVGYNDYLDTSLLIDESHTFDSITLFEQSKEVVVSGFREPEITTIDPVTGNQVFEAETYHAPPTARMTQLVQENLMGAVRAPTGEVHIRGMHGEYTYYVDGAPIPLGVFGGLNEVVDPKVIERATFFTGGWPAEYGGQIAAIVDIQNRVPTGSLHATASTYGGSYIPAVGKDSIIQPNRFLNMNGQSLSISDHIGKLGFFVSGSRQETDRRIDPPVQTIFHDHGFDYFLYGKADYLLSEKDYLTMNLNYGVTNTQVPFDSIESGLQDDLQYTTNAFQTLSYFRVLSNESDHESNLQVAGFAREGSLTFTPGAVDQPQLAANEDSTLPPDTAQHVFSSERSFTTLGIRTKYDHRLSHNFMYAAGLVATNTHGSQDFGPFDLARFTSAPHTTADFNGSDLGVFFQAEWHPAEWTRIDGGIRYDQHATPDTTEKDWSPRLKWNFLIDENNSAYLYYGHLFMPNNIEALRVLSEKIEGATPVPTVAQRSNFYEAVAMHTFDFGLRSKLAYFRNEATPGVDDETVGSSAVKTPVNIENVHTQGLELGLSFSSPLTAFSGYINTALIHAYGSGAITGGFLPFDNAGDAADLDHDQRLSIVASLNYQPDNWFANVTGIYGSGLTNGNEDAMFKTGLFDFNQDAHTTPAWIFDVSAGYTFKLTGGATISPSLFIGNLFDHEHLLKGSFFSAASWEEPRRAIFKIEAQI